MTSPSDVLDCVGFLRADVQPLLAEAGITLPDGFSHPAPPRADWPAWKRRFAIADYLTDDEAAAALAGLDLSAPGYLPDEAQAELWHWQELIKRACGAGSLVAEGTDWNGDGTPRVWAIAPRALAAWCASRNPPIPYPLPGDPTTAIPTTDAGLRDAMAVSEKERAEWKAKAESLAGVQQRCADLQAEINRLLADLRAKADEAAALIAKRDELKADALAGKSRTTALKIIGGLATSVYCMDIRANRLEKIGEVVSDLQRAGVEVNEKTLRGWIKDAAAVIDTPTKNASATAKPA